MLFLMDEDQSTSSLIHCSNSVSETSQKKRKKTKKFSSSKRISDVNSLDSGDRSHASDQESGAWANIFAPCKVMVCMQSRNLSDSKTMITYAEKDFFENFEYGAESALPFPLKRLFGRGTVRRAIHDLEMSVLSGKNTFQFMNLYTAGGSPLSCHVNAVCINGNRARVPAEMRTIRDCKEKYAVLTIRSSSLIGNAKQHGIGFFGPHKVAQYSDDEASSNGSRKRARKDSSDGSFDGSF